MVLSQRASLLKKLNGEVRRQQLLADLAIGFAENRDFDVQMSSTIERIGKYVQVSRVYIFEDDAESSCSTTNTFEWCNEGVSPQKLSRQAVPYKAIASGPEILKANGRIYSEDIHELPGDLVAILKRQGVLSIVVYPLLINNAIRGFVGFDECVQKRRWSKSELDLLRTVCGIFSAAIERERRTRALATSERNFRAMVEAIDDLVMVVAPQGNILYTNRAVELKLGYSLQECTTMHVLHFHPEQYRREAAENIAEVSRHERNTCPLPLLSKAGELLPVETRVWPGVWNGRECTLTLHNPRST